MLLPTSQLINDKKSLFYTFSLYWFMSGMPAVLYILCETSRVRILYKITIPGQKNAVLFVLVCIYLSPRQICHPIVISLLFTLGFQTGCEYTQSGTLIDRHYFHNAVLQNVPIFCIIYHAALCEYIMGCINATSNKYRKQCNVKYDYSNK